MSEDKKKGFFARLTGGGGGCGCMNVQVVPEKDAVEQEESKVSADKNKKRSDESKA